MCGGLEFNCKTAGETLSRLPPRPFIGIIPRKTGSFEGSKGRTGELRGEFFGDLESVSVTAFRRRIV